LSNGVRRASRFKTLFPRNNQRAQTRCHTESCDVLEPPSRIVSGGLVMTGALSLRQIPRLPLSAFPGQQTLPRRPKAMTSLYPSLLSFFETLFLLRAPAATGFLRMAVSPGFSRSPPLADHTSPLWLICAHSRCREALFADCSVLASTTALFRLLRLKTLGRANPPMQGVD